MFEATPNNNQPTEEKKPFGKFGVFLVVLSFFCVAGLLYYYVPKILAPDPTKTVAVPEKTDMEKVKEDIKLIKQGYTRSISGEIKEISGNKITISAYDVDENKKDYIVSVNDKTKFSKTIYKSGEIKVIEISDSIEFEDNIEEETIPVNINDLKEGIQTVVILSKLVMLDKQTNLVAEEIRMAEEIQQQEDVIVEDLKQ